MPERLSWAEYGLAIADAVATRSEDPWACVGAVLFRGDNTVVSVGYNGAPSGMDIDWSSKKARDRHVIHAEVNALRYATPREAEWLASTRHPCPNCLLLLRSNSVMEVVYRERGGSSHDEAMVLAKELGMNVWRIP